MPSSERPARADLKETLDKDNDHGSDRRTQKGGGHRRSRRRSREGLLLQKATSLSPRYLPRRWSSRYQRWRAGATRPAPTLAGSAKGRTLQRCSGVPPAAKPRRGAPRHWTLSPTMAPDTRAAMLPRPCPRYTSGDAWSFTSGERTNRSARSAPPTRGWVGEGGKDARPSRHRRAHVHAPGHLPPPRRRDEGARTAAASGLGRPRVSARAASQAVCRHLGQQRPPAPIEQIRPPRTQIRASLA